MNNTWYDDTLINRFKQKEQLANNRKCAVLIVGGGLAGLSLLYKLKKKKH
jgi:monoamine oxidase